MPLVSDVSVNRVLGFGLGATTALALACALAAIVVRTMRCLVLGNPRVAACSLNSAAL